MKSNTEVITPTTAVVAFDEATFRVEFARRLADAYEYYVDCESKQGWETLGKLHLSEHGRQFESIYEVRAPNVERNNELVIDCAECVTCGKREPTGEPPADPNKPTVFKGICTQCCLEQLPKVTTQRLAALEAAARLVLVANPNLGNESRDLETLRPGAAA